MELLMEMVKTSLKILDPEMLVSPDGKMVQVSLGALCKLVDQIQAPYMRLAPVNVQNRTNRRDHQ
jgi:hypothetical protein